MLLGLGTTTCPHFYAHFALFCFVFGGALCLAFSLAAWASLTAFSSSA